MANLFAQTLRSVIEYPDKTLQDYMLSWEKDQLRHQKWPNQLPATVERCIHDVIKQQVIIQPQAIAVSAWDKTFTYFELEETAVRLAHHLKRLGVGKEKIVPLCFEKSAWAIVGILAVLKAGGAFVFLDPVQPTSRLLDIVNGADAEIILTSSENAHLMASLLGSVVVINQTTLSQLPLHADEPVSGGATSRSAAYVIFTSGTTGKPKGTVIEHGSYCSGAAVHTKAMHMNSKSRVLQFASYTFDACMSEILTPLMVGAAVCVPHDHERLHDITRAMDRLSINWALLTPSFVQFIDPLAVPKLQVLVLGGEAMSQTNLTTWSDKVTLVNAYGPTECSVIATVNSVVHHDSDPSNIGRSVCGHAWIVEPGNHNILVSVGSIGELVIEGPTIARGYLKDKKRTNQSFIENPTWAAKVAHYRRRMYKTGDLARLNDDGTLTFVGRKDTQVKIHGHRVELSEIEHHLTTQKYVSHALAVVPITGYVKQRLTAVICLSQFSTTKTYDTANQIKLAKCTDKSIQNQISSIRNSLLERLPNHLIPSLWIPVEVIPLLPSGKMDRKLVDSWVSNLPKDIYYQITEYDTAESSNSDTEPNDIFSLPRSVIESKIHRIWAHVLNFPLHILSFDRGFLNLGGDSISALQVMSKCRSEGIRLNVQNIIRSKSISELAKTAKPVEQMSYEDEVDVPFDLSPIQKLWFSLPGQSVDCTTSHFNQSFLMQLTRYVDRQRIQDAIEELVLRHSMLRARFSESGTGVWQQRISNDTLNSYRLHHHHFNVIDEAYPVISATHKSLNVKVGPLFAADLFEIKNGNQHLFLVAHHLVIDLVSWRIILQDLEDILEHKVISWDKVLPFQAWNKLQIQHSQTSSSAKVLPLEVSQADPDFWGLKTKYNTYSKATRETFTIEQEVSKILLTGCHNALNTEPVDILLSGILHSFRQVFADRAPLTVYNESHGREPWDASIDLSGTVGWFTTMYPITVKSTSDVINTVRTVKDLRRKIPYNGRPYFAYRQLNIEGTDTFSHHWPFEATFNYLGQYQQFERNDSLLRPIGRMAGEVTGAGEASDVGKLAPRVGIFEISAGMVNGEIEFAFIYSKELNHQDKIKQWVTECGGTVKRIVYQLMNMSPQPTLADFPLIPLTYGSMDRLLDSVLPGINLPNLDNVENIYSCTPMQQGILLGQSQNKSYYAVHVTREAKLDSSRVDVHRLLLAWRDVVDRHSMLRTIFVESVCDGSSFDQIVLRTIKAEVIHWMCEESEALDTLECQAAMQTISSEPAHRLSVCETYSGRVFCKLEISHALVDGRSMQLLFRDLSLAYNRETKLSKAAPYSHYVDYVQNQPGELSIQYWTEYLRGASPCEFPILIDELKEEDRLSSIQIVVDDLSDMMKLLAERGLTISTILHTAWGLVLQSYTGLDSVCFGYLSSERDALIDGLQDAVGPIINMLPCRIDLAHSDKLTHVLEQVQTGFLGSLAHRSFSLADVYHNLGLSHTALFNTVLSFQNNTGDLFSKGALLYYEDVTFHDPTEVSNFTTNQMS